MRPKCFLASKYTPTNPHRNPKQATANRVADILETFQGREGRLQAKKKSRKEARLNAWDGGESATCKCEGYKRGKEIGKEISREKKKETERIKSKKHQLPPQCKSENKTRDMANKTERY